MGVELCSVIPSRLPFSLFVNYQHVKKDSFAKDHTF